MISEWVGSDRVGSVIEGRFHLQHWLGGADESGVFLTQIGGALPRNAAIKIIPAGIADAESLLSQWMKAKQRTHPNLIRLYHAGYCRIDDCDLLYTVTDCADEILADVLRVRALTPAEVREMLIPILDTLSWLHGRGLVHGGLKPSNVMVVSEQIELSVDRIQPPGPRIFPLLSPGIQDAPESAGKVAPPSDLWSLGVLIVEALTQSPPPWDGTGYRIPASVPQPFAEIASECLRLDPVRRCTLREIRSHLAPAPRAVASTAPVSRPHVAAEPARVPPVPAAVSADPPKKLSPDLPPVPPPISSPVSSPIPSFPAPPHFAERVAALLVPAPIVTQPISKMAQSAAEAPRLVEIPHVLEGPAAFEESPAVVAPVTQAPIADAPVVVSPIEETPTPKDAASSSEAPPAGTLAEPFAALRQPALDTTDWSADATPHGDAHRLSLAAAMQRRANLPAPAPPVDVRKPPSHYATLVASAMIVIAAGMMLAIALYRTRPAPLPAAGSSAASAPPVSARANPPQQLSAVPASAPPPSTMLVSAASGSAPQVAAAGVPAGPITPGAVINRVLPDITQHAIDTIRGRLVVIVQVRVDSNGNVEEAGYDYEGNSHYLKTAALQAARDWKFRPAEVGGHPVPSTWVLQFWFDQTGPSVIAKETTS